MSLLLNILALLRLIAVFGLMSIFITIYLLTTFFIPHTKDRALRLREMFLTYVGIPLLNIKIEKSGYPEITPALYVSNHRSFTDPVVICRYLKAFVIGKAEVAGYPIISKGAELTGVIWVDRNSKASRTDTRSKMIEVLKSGYNILVYPEGTVGTHRHTLPFRKGTFMEAAANNIPVVPIAIEYDSPKDLWIKEKFVPQYFYQFSKWRTNVKVRFGTPFFSDNGDELHQKAHDWINEQLTDMQENWANHFK